MLRYPLNEDAEIRTRTRTRTLPVRSSAVIEIYVYFLQFHFIVKEADTDTTVVPRGVVAAMKALREQKETSQGGDFLLMWCSQCCDLS